MFCNSAARHAHKRSDVLDVNVVNKKRDPATPNAAGPIVNFLPRNEFEKKVEIKPPGI